MFIYLLNFNEITKNVNKMEKSKNATTKIIAIGIFISVLIIMNTCTLFKKEEWIKVKGVYGGEGRKRNIRAYADNSFAQWLEKYADLKNTELFINIKSLNDNTKIIKAKLTEDSRIIYLVTKNPDYKMGGATSKFSHMIIVQADEIIYLQLDL